MFPGQIIGLTLTDFDIISNALSFVICCVFTAKKRRGEVLINTRHPGKCVSIYPGFMPPYTISAKAPDKGYALSGVTVVSIMTDIAISTCFKTHFMESLPAALPTGTKNFAPSFLRGKNIEDDKTVSFLFKELR